MEMGLILALALSNFLLVGIYFFQRHTINKTQSFLNNFIENSEVIVEAVEKCIAIVNKNAELLLKTAEKTDGLEEEITRLKVVYDLTKDYLNALETLNEARRIEIPLSKRVYQLSHTED
jgi:hypothetical protein